VVERHGLDGVRSVSWVIHTYNKQPAELQHGTAQSIFGTLGPGPKDCETWHHAQFVAPQLTELVAQLLCSCFLGEISMLCVANEGEFSNFRAPGGGHENEDFYKYYFFTTTAKKPFTQVFLGLWKWRGSSSEKKPDMVILLS